jgi:endoglucanase
VESPSVAILAEFARGSKSGGWPALTRGGGRRKLASMRALLALFLAGSVCFGIAWAQMTDTPPPPSDAAGSVVQLGHGINLGNMLEGKTEGAMGQTVHEEYFPIIRQAGFSVVRVPIRWSAHVGPAPDYTIDPTFLSRIDWVVAEAEKNGLNAILDYHNDDELMQNPDAYADRYLAIWKQVAEHFKDAPSSILFELLNEPNGKMDARHWNRLLAKALAVVRATNPARTVVVGPTNWNDVGHLNKLELPESDRNLLVTIHFYDPMSFTHQGADWVAGSSKWMGTTWQGTEAEKQAIARAFEAAAAWGAAHRRPMFLGEFGSYGTGDMASRARWTAFVARTAESHGMPWTYWEFCSGFGAYDPVAKQWRQPLLDALLPK